MKGKTDERESGFRPDQGRSRQQRRGAVHEGHAHVPAMRLLRRRGSGAVADGREVQGRQRPGRHGNPRRHQGLHQLADDPAALRQRRIRRRLRHHPRNVRKR